MWSPCHKGPFYANRLGKRSNDSLSSYSLGESIMDEDRKQKKGRDGVCQACNVISKVQCKQLKDSSIEPGSLDDSSAMKECPSCGGMYRESEEYSMESLVEDGSCPQEPKRECEFDCYPYTFSPLLLFAQAQYFDKGYSNYNSVAQFFGPAIDVNMLENVLYERKNMLYEELFNHVTKNKMLVTCCIDAHFTAFQVLGDKAVLYYDPLSPKLSYVTGDSYLLLVGFLLIKCSYGDSQHMQENKDYYTGSDSNPVRRQLYKLWQKINALTVASLHGVRWNTVSLNLNRYVLINSKRDPSLMSTQLTGNTCYFQTYLFGVLCKAGVPTLSRNNSSIDIQDEDKLVEVTTCISRFLLEFFVEEKGGHVIMRPLSNSNVILDFFRYKDAPYFASMTSYLQHLRLTLPEYDLQYDQLMQYFTSTKTLHTYQKFSESGVMSSSLNTKSLQPVYGTDDSLYKLARSNYYKYRATNLMFGFNANIMSELSGFCEFNSLRKNQLLAFYEKLQPLLRQCRAATSMNKYRDYYFMPQFEVGQQELVDVHHYTYLLDICAMLSAAGSSGDSGQALIARINDILADDILFSTQKRSNYDKLMKLEDFRASRKHFNTFLTSFFSTNYLKEFVGLGFAEINPKEKDINSLTQTVFYCGELMSTQAYRMEYEFEKECINQMARSTLRKYDRRFEGSQDMGQKYRISMKIGYGYTYSKYNTLMHFLNVVECYWQNPDLNNIQVFGKDIRTLLNISCQKIFFEEGHNYYYYGPVELSSDSYRSEVDLTVSTSIGTVTPGVCRTKRGKNEVVVTDRVYEYGYLRHILNSMFSRVQGGRLKSDNAILNLCLLSLLLDFGLYEEYATVLNLPFLQRLQNLNDKCQLHVEVANQVQEFDRKNSTDAVTRLKLEELIFEASYKFLVNKGFSAHCKQNALIQELNGDPAYQQHLLLCKVNMSLCQINKSVEVDYYKVRCNGKYGTIIPRNFSKITGEYLEQVTSQYTFSDNSNVVLYDEIPLFDLRDRQPEINLYRIRFDSATDVQSMVKYVEIKNAFRAIDTEQKYVVFIANNALVVDVSVGSEVTIRINKIAIEVATIFFNKAISFVPCFKYADSEDVILFASQNIHYLVDQGGQFCTDYYGMKHELIECIESEEFFLDLNDDHVCKKSKLSELLTDSKTVINYPDYLLQVPSRQQLINLLDLSIHIRNLSFFIIVLIYLRRSSVALHFIEQESRVAKITGPWKEAIYYVLNRAPNAHYEQIFSEQFFDLNRHEHMPLKDFVDVLCENFTRYQRMSDDGCYQIVPTEKQKLFLQHIITAEECFHFSEVGSGKTKVIIPLLCQTFLSNNIEAHTHLAKGGKAKDVLVILVPEHLVPDAKTQVYRYCLNLNFREEYRVYDDIFALSHDNVQLGSQPAPSPQSRYSRTPARVVLPHMKKIFVTSFNMFKKALTYDTICAKVWSHREHILVIADEVDDFLDRDKLVFNICSNKGNAFDKPTLDLYFEVSRAAYHRVDYSSVLVDAATNAAYWRQLCEKFSAIHTEIQDASRSVNKSFGIFNEQALRHCSTNIAHDIEGYKSLIARPYESVNRAMPGSYYSDVERTIYLTYVILLEDIGKYNDLFQEERKFISFEYWNAYVKQLDYDDLVYGTDLLSDVVVKHPEIKEGLIRFLYSIILRRMEIRDKSRSVNSIDIVFNFDCLGFTGTPFIDNYPTFSYIRHGRQDDIPNMIDRSFYAYSSDALTTEQFEDRFRQFQGQNNNVLVEYVSSDFIKSSDRTDELAILEQIFVREEQVAPPAAGTIDTTEGRVANFNVIVDLCGIFKRSTIHDIRDLVLRHFGPDRFSYIYHIDPVDSSDRVLRIDSDNDVQFDEEFYKYLKKKYGAELREKVFFFVDNRNVIGKDIPFQLNYQRRFGEPMFTKSVVLAHDVDDFSKIWQAMGRSRTMNHTVFSIYKSGLPSPSSDSTISEGVQDIKTQALTRQLYVHNCDCKMAGNLSSIYQTLISLLNLSQKRFYYCDEIVNSFLEKMMLTIAAKLRKHEDILGSNVLSQPLPSRILAHILTDKFQKSSISSVVSSVATEGLSASTMQTLVGHIVQQKYEQRVPVGDVFDDYIIFLSGEQQSLMEVSYTKQQQKQKQKQQNKNQDSDTMDIFDKKNQMLLSFEMDNYFDYTLSPEFDLPKISLSLPLSVPIMSCTYSFGGEKRSICVYPTVQFLYSHHIQAAYITKNVKDCLNDFKSASNFCDNFLEVAEARAELYSTACDGSEQGEDGEGLGEELSIGKSVVIHGLSAEELNGLRGVIVRAGEEGRWGVEVQLPYGSAVVGKPIKSIRARNLQAVASEKGNMNNVDVMQQLNVKLKHNLIRQNPQYSLAAIQKGVYVIGMKDQFNVHDLSTNPLVGSIQYVADEMGFVLFDKNDHRSLEMACIPTVPAGPASASSIGSRNIDTFGPYFIEQYILMEVLSKHEVAQNVLNYFVNHIDKLQEALTNYDEKQGKGFICWRFLLNEASKRTDDIDLNA